MNRIIHLLLMFFFVITVVSCSEQQITGQVIDQDSNDLITIGVIQSLTGSGAQQGNNAKQGIELAVEHINQQNGINDRKLQMMYDDEKCDAKTGLSIAQKFIEVNNVSVIIGPGCSGTSMAVAPLAEQKKVIMIKP